jgi:hypothetical protein
MLPTRAHLLLTWFDKMINQRKGIRRMILSIIMILIWIVVWRATTAEVLIGASTGGAAIVATIFSLLVLPIKWYFEARKNDSSPD